MDRIAPNNSGGTIDASGAYVAGGKGGVSDTVLVADSLGNTATAAVAVSGSGGGCNTSAGAGPLALLLGLCALHFRRRRA